VDPNGRQANADNRSVVRRSDHFVLLLFQCPTGQTVKGGGRSTAASVGRTAERRAAGSVQPLSVLVCYAVLGWAGLLDFSVGAGLIYKTIVSDDTLMLLLLLHLCTRLCHILYCGLEIVHLTFKTSQLLIQSSEPNTSGVV